jgi:hypothetical protein
LIGLWWQDGTAVAAVAATVGFDIPMTLGGVRTGRLREALRLVVAAGVVVAALSEAAAVAGGGRP